jgi:hypothetical protein
MNKSIVLCLFLCLLVALSEEKKEDKDLGYLWGEKGYKLCKKECKTRKCRSRCETFQEIVEDMIDGMGMQIAGTVEKDTFSNIAARSQTEPWKTAGENMLEEVFEYIVQNDWPEKSEIYRFFQQKFLDWMLKLTTGDTQGINGIPRKKLQKQLRGNLKDIQGQLPPDFDINLLHEAMRKDREAAKAAEAAKANEENEGEL